MESKLMHIIEIANFLSAAIDESDQESINKTRSRMNGYRKQIIADSIDELIQDNHTKGESHSFDERTLSFIKLMSETCNKTRILKDWEYNKCGYESEGDAAAALLKLGREVYSYYYL